MLDPRTLKTCSTVHNTLTLASVAAGERFWDRTWGTAEQADGAREVALGAKAPLPHQHCTRLLMLHHLPKQETDGDETSALANFTILPDVRTTRSCRPMNHARRSLDEPELAERQQTRAWSSLDLRSSGNSTSSRPRVGTRRRSKSCSGSQSR